MSADPPPIEDTTGPVWQQSQVLAQVIEDAMASLTQQRVDGVDSDVDILSSEDEAVDDGMTREIMGPEYTENLTLSRVDFDEWMSTHAELEEEEDEEEYSPDDEHESPPLANVHDKWQADRMAWNLQNTTQAENAGGGTEDDPITIGSSDVDEDDYDKEEYEEEEEYYEEGEDDDGYDMDEHQQQMPHPAGVHQNMISSSSEHLVANAAAQSVGWATASEYANDLECQYDEFTGSGADQAAASVANAMLILNGSLDSSAGESATGQVSPPLSAYQRPPLPPAQLAPSMVEMHKTISQSIDRSLSIVDEISASCDAAVASDELRTPDDSADEQSSEMIGAFESETHSSIELAGQAIERLRTQQAEWAGTQTALNTQIFRLSAELFQAASEKSALESAAKGLERDNAEHSQAIDDLQQKMEALRAKSSAEIEGLRERVRHVAAKLAGVTGELGETSGRLDETKQVLALVSAERTDLLGRCRGLETTVESLVLRLDAEHQQHELTRRALHLASDGNANEAKRAELAAANHGLEQRCKELAGEVAQGKTRERLLFNSNRALEARLGDTLRTLDAPDAHSEQQWQCDRDSLVESRKETMEVRRQLARVEVELAAERRAAELLRARVQELEVSGGRGDQSVKKRRYEDDFVVVTPVRPSSYAPVTPSRLPADGSAAWNTLAGYSGFLQKTLVDAGEHARDRQRKHDVGTPTRPPKAGGPVTPRIGLNR
ncbi:hypothetical protein H4S07_001535 [Coemansia furcata]|uniref:Uncharacterized protein n=1 Tax=Coemansia furcata TaxID=417177 RepID=A0ACC1LP54_9FUNG|nr:hypothetical protein H4S07_001535 [Coemansia furcata]